MYFFDFGKFFIKCVLHYVVVFYTLNDNILKEWMEMKLSVKIGERIVEIRNNQKISQEELCNIAGISRKAMHNIENGKCDVKSETLAKILVALDVSYGEFFSTIDLKKIEV